MCSLLGKQVSIAAPKDSKQLFDGTIAGISVLEKITSLEKSVGMKGTLVETKGGNSMVTLTGEHVFTHRYSRTLAHPTHRTSFAGTDGFANINLLRATYTYSLI